MRQLIVFFALTMFISISCVPLVDAISINLDFIGSQSGGFGTVVATDNLNGSYTAVSGSVLLNGTPFILYPANPNAPSYSVSPTNSFWYNNLIYQQDPFLDIYGLLFISATGLELNLWGNGAGQPYTLYTGQNGTYFIQDSNVTFDSSPVPEPASFLLIAIGLAGGCLYSFRKSNLKEMQTDGCSNRLAT